MERDERRPDPWLRALSGAIDAGVLLVSAEHGVEYASAPALDLLGVGSFENLRARWPELQAQVERALPRPLGDSPRLTADVEIALDENARRWLRWQFFRPGGVETHQHVVLLRDLAQIEQVHGELCLAARYLAFSRLYSASAHDLRGPLNAIALNLEVLKNSVPAADVDPDAAQCLASIDVEFDRFKRAFEVFLKQSRPPEDARRSFDFVELAQEVGLLIGPAARRQKIDIALDLPSQPLPLTGRRDRLLQALVVVALNGLEAMPNGGQLAIGLVPEPAALRLSIADTGPGIPAEILPRIWDVHFSTRRNGAGLGLYVARVIVEEHGGTIRIDRTDAHGTLFVIEIPIPPEQV